METIACNDYFETENRRVGIERRSFLGLGGAALAAWAFSPKTALAQASLHPDGVEGNALVVLFLRGGMDGLNAIPPFGEDEYYRLRPSLALGRPQDRTRLGADRAIDLDGFFGMHSALSPLESAFKSGDLAVVHAVGSGDQTRSHFEAMSAMERGISGGTAGAVGGWLARYLRQTSRSTDTALRAVALSGTLPDSLLGATQAVNLYHVDEYNLNGSDTYREQLESLYAKGSDPVSSAGRGSLAALRKLDQINVKTYRPADGAIYPDSELGAGFKQIAALLKGGVGLEIACLERGGWDTHVTQGAVTGWLASQLDDVAKSMAAFQRDMGAGMKRVTVVAMTEFGRRAYENTGLGTDHGRGSCLFLLGGGVRGGKVYAHWPGLAKDQLEAPGDLRVTTDYRDVLGEVLIKRSRLRAIGDVFPGHTLRTVGAVG